MEIKTKKSYLSNERSQLILQDDAYDCNYRQEITRYVHRNAAEKYINNKMDVSEQDLKKLTGRPSRTQT